MYLRLFLIIAPLAACATPIDKTPQPSVDSGLVDTDASDTDDSDTDDSDTNPPDTNSPPASGYALVDLQPVASCDSLFAVLTLGDLDVELRVPFNHLAWERALLDCDPFTGVAGFASGAATLSAKRDGHDDLDPCRSLEDVLRDPDWLATAGEVHVALAPTPPPTPDPVGSCIGKFNEQMGTVTLDLRDVVLTHTTGDFAPIGPGSVTVELLYRTQEVPH